MFLLMRKLHVLGVAMAFSQAQEALLLHVPHQAPQYPPGSTDPYHPLGLRKACSGSALPQFPPVKSLRH